MILILALTLLALLPVFAVLQYKWLGDVSMGERDRMRANLRASASRFVKEFNHELTTIYLRFRPAPVGFWSNSVDLKPFEKLLEQTPPGEMYRQWIRSTKYPELIEAVYQARLDAEGQAALSRLNLETGQMTAVDWPQKLEPIKRGLEAQRAAAKETDPQKTMIRRFGEIDTGALNGRNTNHLESRIFRTTIPVNGGPFPALQSDIPAVVAPQNTDPAPLAFFGSPLAASSYIVVTLNHDYIKQEMLPQLAKQCFANGGKDEYIVTVLDRGSAPGTLYQSESKSADLSGLSEQELATSDVASSLFALNLEEVDHLTPKFLFQQRSRETAKTKDGDQKGEGKFSISIIRSTEKQVQAQANISGNNPDAVRERGETTPRMIVGGLINGSWELIVRHRAGSLEAAVENLRRRNLAISFGILLLLCGSVGLIVLLSQRAQRLAERQMEFVAGVSHELRTPLAVICSAAENLADGVIDNRDQIKRYGGLIRDEGRRLGGMVEQVLEFAGAQSGRKTYDLRSSDLRMIVDDALVACHLQILEGGFEIERRFPRESPQIWADAAALGRAIQNLLNNAMKYSGESRWIGLFVESAGDDVLIKVSDRGVGVRTAETSRIFEPFFRGKEATDAQIHGNGLGLSLVKHIVEAHQGSVSVESKVGQGSVFTLRLPILTDVREPQIEPAISERAV